MPLLLALDQGTTSSRAVLFRHNGTQIAAAQREFQQFFPRPGWVEHDPVEIWETQLATAREVVAAAGGEEIAAIGIANQRETTILWEKATGRAVHPAIVWQDRRTADACHRLKQTHAEMIQRKTGLIPDAYFSASKLQWLLENVPGARERAGRGKLLFGTVDTWLLWNLTGGPCGGVHATDASNASRTMLLNIHTGQWDEELLALFDVPTEVLPQVRDSAGEFGRTDLLGGDVPICGIAGDQQAALFGQNCLSPGLAKNTYGTGCFLLMNTGETAVASQHQLLTTIAWSLPRSPSQSKIENQKSKMDYALEGSVFVGGAVVQWLRDGLHLIHSATEIEGLARSVPDHGGVYLVPAFAGLGAPFWDQYARGTIVGITRGTTAGHIARAALEAIAFQVADLLDVMHADMPSMPMRELRVDGGASRNSLLLQFQADMLRIAVLRPKVTETTALGAAMLAGVGAGVFASLAELEIVWQAEAEFLPAISDDEAAYRRRRWSAALSRAREWEEAG